jgi:NTE family protein
MAQNSKPSSAAQVSFLLASFFFFVGCSQLQTRDEIAKARSQSQGQKQVGNTQVPSSQPATQEPVTPRQEKKVALILGPGGYKTFAHTGVIKELRKQNIPIHKVVGLEMGALVAALYAQRGQINEAEWKLYKLEKTDLDQTGFFSRKSETRQIKVLDSYFKENLDAKDVSRTEVPFFCPSLNLNQGALMWQDSGSLVSAVRNCMAYPPLFSTQQAFVAGVFSLDLVAERLRSEGYNILIFVNVLGDGNLFDNTLTTSDYAPAVLWNEVRRSLWASRSLMTDVIDVTTRGMSLTDFSTRKLLATAGEAAGEKAAKQLADKYDF